MPASMRYMCTTRTHQPLNDCLEANALRSLMLCTMTYVTYSKLRLHYTVLHVANSERYT